MGLGMLISNQSRVGAGRAAYLLPLVPPPLTFHQDPSAFGTSTPQTFQPSTNMLEASEPSCEGGEKVFVYPFS